MGRFIFTTSYSRLGEYYSPIKVFIMLKDKYRRLNWTILLMPIRLLIFLPLLFISLLNLPCFLLNKLFYFLNEIDWLFLLVWIINGFYYISYCIYIVLVVVEILFIMIYEKIPPKLEELPMPSTVIPKDDLFY